MDKMRVSVAMATYNGAEFIEEQIKSILVNLNENDEIVVSDDGSTDETIQILKNINDERIKIFDGPKNGVKKNFENAILNCKGEYIFLSDQDDIWLENKVNTVLENFEKNQDVSLIVHDATVFNSETKETMYESFFKYRNSGSGIIKNIWKNTYIGCCMAFKKELVEFIIPIPNNIEMHDQWIGIINEKKLKKSLFIEDKLVMYRRHENNTSKMEHYGILKMIKNRAVLINQISLNKKIIRKC